MTFLLSKIHLLLPFADFFLINLLKINFYSFGVLIIAKIPVKRISLPTKIGLLMILAVILLSATGYLSYRNLSSIVTSIRIDVKPDLRLLSIRQISMDLEKAQNSIRIYTNTHDTLDLQTILHHNLKY